jgi:hypothetical protein
MEGDNRPAAYALMSLINYFKHLVVISREDNVRDGYAVILRNILLGIGQQLSVENGDRGCFNDLVAMCDNIVRTYMIAVRDCVIRLNYVGGSVVLDAVNAIGVRNAENPLSRKVRLCMRMMEASTMWRHSGIEPNDGILVVILGVSWWHSQDLAGNVEKIMKAD